LAAGLEQYEPADGYAVDLLTGARKLDQEATLASSYVLSAKAFSNMTEAAFSSRYGEIYRALPYLIGSKPEVVSRLHQLHERHGKAVIEVVNERLARGANVEAILSREHTSLLAVLQTPITGAKVKDAVEEAPTASDQAATIEFMPIERPIGFAVDVPRRRVLFKGGVRLKGALFELFNAMRRLFEEDQAANLPQEQCRTLTAGKLADDLALDDGTVRKNVARVRRSLQTQFRVRLREVVGEDDIIENVPPRGYRLNPYLVRQHAWQLGVSTGDKEPMPQRRGRSAAIRRPQA
jgi:hypothetical protein